MDLETTICINTSFILNHDAYFVIHDIRTTYRRVFCFRNVIQILGECTKFSHTDMVGHAMLHIYAIKLPFLNYIPTYQYMINVVQRMKSMNIYVNGVFQKVTVC